MFTPKKLSKGWSFEVKDTGDKDIVVGVWKRDGRKPVHRLYRRQTGQQIGPAHKRWDVERV